MIELKDVSFTYESGETENKEVMKPSRPSDLRYPLIWLWQARRDD